MLRRSEQGEDEMLRNTIAWLLIIGLSWSTALAQTEPADSAIKGALYDIERAEQQLPTLTPSRAANIKRVQRSLSMAQERLDSSANKDHPSWAEANARLAVLNAALAALAGGGEPAATPPPTQAAPATPAETAPTASTPTPETAPPVAQADPNVDRAGRELDMIKRQIESSRPGDLSLGSRFLGDLARIRQQLDAVADKSHATFGEVEAAHAATKKLVVDNVLVGIRHNYQLIVDHINNMQPLQYLVKADVDQVGSNIVTVYNQLTALDSPDHPDVAALMGGIQQVAQELERRVADAKAEHAKLGDVDAQVAAIQDRAFSIKVPEALLDPVTSEQVATYANGVTALRAHMEQDLAWLKSIDGRTPMDVDQSNLYRRLVSMLEFEKPSDLDISLSNTIYAVDIGPSTAITYLDFVNETDPGDVNHRANRLLGEGRFEEMMDRLNKGIESVKTAQAFDQAMARTDAPDRGEQLALLEAGVETAKAKRAEALGSMSMPEAKSDDPDLLAAAAEVLARPDYSYEYERLVISYGPHHRSRSEGTIDPGTVTTTISVYDYEWDEFQATTAEKVGDKFFLFVNEFRFYNSGGNTTPLDRWILTDRFQTSEIPEENINN